MKSISYTLAVGLFGGILTAYGDNDPGACSKADDQMKMARQGSLSDDERVRRMDELYLDMSALGRSGAQSGLPPGYLKNCLQKKQRAFMQLAGGVMGKERSSQRYNLLMARVNELLGNPEPERSFRAYEAALLADPNDSSVRWSAYKAWARWQLARAQQSAASIKIEDREALKSKSKELLDPLVADPKMETSLKVEALMLRARLWEALAQLADGMKDYERVLELDPRHAPALHHLLSFELSRKNWAGARTWAARLVEASPQNLLAHKQLLELQMSLGESSALLLSAQNASKLFPQDADVQSYLARALVDNARVPEGQALARKLLQKNPKNSVARDTLKRAFEIEGDAHASKSAFGQALAAYKSALKLGDARTLRVKMASVLFAAQSHASNNPAARQDMDQALAWLPEAQKGDGDETELQLLVNIAARSSQPSKARKSCEKLRQLGALGSPTLERECARVDTLN